MARAYDKIRIIIEKHNGTMTFQREGSRHGAWTISLNGNTTTMELEGNSFFPELDKFYVPKVDEPKTWNDYKNELLPDAEKDILKQFS